MNTRIKFKEGDLGGLTKRIGELRKSLSQVADVVALEVVELISDGFANERDPYGRPWKAKYHDDGRAILVHSGRMKTGWHGRIKKPRRNTRVISPNVDYAKYHQFGTQGRTSIGVLHRSQPYVNDFIQAGKVGSKRGRFMSRQQAKSLGRKGSAIAVRSFTIHFATGSGKIPARMMIPADGDIPPRWQEAIDKAFAEAFKEFIK